MKKKHPAIEELYKLIKTQDWSSFCPEKTRAELLSQWEEKWLVDVSADQLVTDTKYLNSEYSDIIKEKMAQNLAEQLTEDCVSFTIKDRSISAQMIGIKRCLVRN